MPANWCTLLRKKVWLSALLLQVQVCDGCPAGEYRHMEAQVGFICTKCEPGLYAPAAATSCTACPYDYYSKNSGTPACTMCKKGKLTQEKGATVCIEGCVKGKYRPEGTSEPCSSCEPNTYQASMWQTSCENCPEGKFTQEVGSAKCTVCAGSKGPRPCFCPLLELTFASKKKGVVWKFGIKFDLCKQW
jgi:hypothetical protein